MKLDVKDKKILQELDLNPKISTSKLGKKVRVSQQVADYRLKKLQENGTIKGFGTIINQGVIGYEQYRILFQLNASSEQEKTKILEQLKAHNKVYWAALVGGKWDLFLTVFVKEYTELEELLDQLFTEFPKALVDYDTSYVITHNFYPHKFIFNKAQKWRTLSLYFAGKNTGKKIDKLDHQIIKEIANNCRQSSLQIGQKLGVTYKTIQNRVKALEAKGVIEGYRLLLDLDTLGYTPYMLFIPFKNFGLYEERKIFAYASQHPLITQSTKIFGNYSLILHVRARNNRELQDVIIDLRKKFPVIGSCDVIPVFKDVRVNLLPQ